MIKLVIFDMDGLVLDTEGISAEGWIFAGKILGYELERDIVISTAGTSWRETCEIFARHYGADFPGERAYVIKTKYIDDHIKKHGLKAKDGLFYALDFLKKENIPCYIATSSMRDRATLLLTKIGAINYFKGLICGGDVEKGKPAPDIFLKALSCAKTRPEDAIVLEDSQYGIMAAYNAGIRSVLIPDTAEINPPYNTYPCAVLESLERVPQWIIENG